MRTGAFARIAILMLMLSLVLASGVAASQITYSLTGFDSVGDPVQASINFNTTAGALSIFVVNLQSPTNVGQNISDIQFTLNTNQSSGTLNAGPLNVNQAWSVAATTGFVTGIHNIADMTTTGWTLQNNVNLGLGDGLRLCVLCAGVDGPHTIIGPPISGTYSGADTTIKGSANNPFLEGTIQFALTVPGLVGGNTDYVDSVFVSFGTTHQTVLQAHCIPGTAGQVSCLPERHRVPEPSSLLLLGAGLLGLAGFGLRKQRNPK